MPPTDETKVELQPDEIKQIARLAHIKIEETQIQQLATDLTQILQFVDQLAAIDTEGVAPLAHPLEMVQRLRKDTVTEEDQRESFQAVAPQIEEGLYLVPKVIE